MNDSRFYRLNLLQRVSATILLGCLIPAFAAAQIDGSLKKHRVVVSKALPNAPVTALEGATAFRQMEQIIRTVTGIRAAAAPSRLSPSASPMSRAEAVEEFSRLYDLTRPKMVVTLPKVAYDPQRITLRDPSVRPRLVRLVAAGCVAQIGPLASGHTPTLTVHEFGDAIGFFLARIAELTNLPSSKWTPYLHN